MNVKRNEYFGYVTRLLRRYPLLIYNKKTRGVYDFPWDDVYDENRIMECLEQAVDLLGEHPEHGKVYRQIIEEYYLKKRRPQSEEKVRKKYGFSMSWYTKYRLNAVALLSDIMAQMGAFEKKEDGHETKTASVSSV